jgi:hypothetical protein
MVAALSIWRPPREAREKNMTIDQGIAKRRLEIERLQGAKRRALQVADERAKEAVALRAELARMRARLAALERATA